MWIELSCSYADLGEDFFESTLPSSAIDPKLIHFNHELANFLKIHSSQVSNKELTDVFSGKKILKSSSPLAMVYAGHQFGHFVPRLGDGRAILLGEVSACDRRRYDVQLKGAGQTKFSRNGDGRSPLGSVIREYIVSEAMHAMGIPSTRALAVVTTGETVYREKAIPGGILTRVSSSHLRVGTFEYFFSRREYNQIKKLMNYAIERHYPELSGEDDEWFEFFRSVAYSKLKLVAEWMSVGFIHGVMNTDNVSIGGETIDFGPCAFMDDFVHDKVFSSIDHQGRYAYHNQGRIALWNLGNLANCLIPLSSLDRKESEKKIRNEFENMSNFFEKTWKEFMGKKLGLFQILQGDENLICDFLKHLEKNHMDFTNSFRHLPKKLNDSEDIYQRIKQRLTGRPESLKQAMELMNTVNPFIIPRNHLVEKAINLADQGDFEFFKDMVCMCKNPYEENLKYKEYTFKPKPHEVIHQTFCGT